MSWDENKHPRDEDGKFTFKNEGKASSNKENPKDILYQKSRKQKEIETIKQKRKNELLDILGNKATHADVLFGDEKSLSKKIKELGLDGKMTGGASGVDKKLNGNEALTKGLQAEIGENYGKTLNNIAKTLFGKDTAGGQSGDQCDHKGSFLCISIFHPRSCICSADTVEQTSPGKIGKRRTEDLF